MACAGIAVLALAFGEHAEVSKELTYAATAFEILWQYDTGG